MRHILVGTLIGLLSFSPYSWAGPVRELDAGVVTFKETTTPATPASGKNKLFFKSSDGKPYYVNSTGTEKPFGSGSGGGSAGYNMLSGDSGNDDFEESISQWTASAGTFARVTSGSGLLIGTGSASWDATAASQTLYSDLVAIPEGLKGRNCLAKILYSGGDANLTLKVHDGTNTVASQALAVASSATELSASFICPSSGSLKIGLESSADAAIVYFDQVHLGENYKIGTVAQAEFVGSVTFPGTTNCHWTTPSSTDSFQSFAADADCTLPSGSNILGSASAPATKIPASTFASLKPGKYVIKAKGLLGINSGNCGIRFSDGTTTTKPQAPGEGYAGTAEGEFEYTTAQANKTWELQMTGSGGAAICNIYANTASRDLTISLYRYPTSSETVYRADVLSQAWNGYHGADCSWVRTSTTFGDYTAGDSTCGFSERVNSNIGTVTSYKDGSNNNLPGVLFTPKTTGIYEICAHPKTGSNGANDISYQLTDGTTQIGATGRRHVTGDNMQQSPLCGLYNVTSLTQKTIRIQGRSGAGAAYVGGSGTSESEIEWTIKNITQNVPMPVIVNSVSSSSSGQERVERATIAEGGVCSTSPCTITRQSGDWLSSVTRNSTGDYTLNFKSGAFTATPTCMITANHGYIYHYGTPSSTSFSFAAQDNAGTLGDTQKMNVICMGPK